MPPSRRQVLSGGAAVASIALVGTNPGRWDVTEGLWSTGSLNPSKWLLAPQELHWDGYHFGYWDLRSHERPSFGEDWDVPRPSSLQLEWPTRTARLLERLLPPSRYGPIDDVLLLESPPRSYPYQEFESARHVAVYTGPTSFLDQVHDAGEDTVDDGEESPRYDGFQYYPGHRRAVGTVDGTSVVVEVNPFYTFSKEYDSDDGRTNFGVLRSLIDARRGRAPRLQDTDGAAAAVVDRLSWDGITAGVAAERNRFYDLVQPHRRAGPDRRVNSAAVEFVPESDSSDAPFDAQLVLAADGPIGDGTAFADRVPALDSWPAFESVTAERNTLQVETRVDAERLRGETVTPAGGDVAIEAARDGEQTSIRYTGDWSFLRGELTIRADHSLTFPELEWSGPSDARFVRAGDETVIDYAAESGDHIDLVWDPEHRVRIDDGRTLALWSHLASAQL